MCFIEDLIYAVHRKDVTHHMNYRGRNTCELQGTHYMICNYRECNTYCDYTDRTVNYMGRITCFAFTGNVTHDSQLQGA